MYGSLWEVRNSPSLEASKLDWLIIALSYFLLGQVFPFIYYAYYLMCSMDTVYEWIMELRTWKNKRISIINFSFVILKPDFMSTPIIS